MQSAHIQHIPYPSIDISRPTPLKFTPLALPPHAHRTAGTAARLNAESPNRSWRRDSTQRREYRQQHTCSIRGNHLGSPITGISFLLLFAGLCAATNAQAYNEGGHYYTLLALFDSQAKAAPENELHEMKLQAVCTELPDMSRELDAISQRVRVLKDMRDNLWGLLGQCQTSVSSHMVASQYYLHALSGTPTYRIREAANAIIKAIDDDLANLGVRQSQRRRNLLCARGFAAHLYGDTFAHVKLSSEKSGFFSNSILREMYQTGLGHLRDGHDPDYLYGHTIGIDKWPQWLQDASANIVAGSDPGSALKSHQPCSDTLAKCEEPARQRLVDILTMKNKLMVSDMQQRIASGNTGIGGIERATTCDDVINSIFPDANDRPQCDSAWKNYLEKAIPIFYNLSIDPTARPDAFAAKSCSAWHCASNSSYNGEAPGTCGVEITDDLSFGREQP